MDLEKGNEISIIKRVAAGTVALTTAACIAFALAVGSFESSSQMQGNPPSISFLDDGIGVFIDGCNSNWMTELIGAKMGIIELSSDPISFTGCV